MVAVTSQRGSVGVDVGMTDIDARRARAICEAQGTCLYLTNRAIEVIRDFECLEGHPDSSVVHDCDIALGRVEFSAEEWKQATHRLAMIVWDVSGKMPDTPPPPSKDVFAESLTQELALVVGRDGVFAIAWEENGLPRYLGMKERIGKLKHEIRTLLRMAVEFDELTLNDQESMFEFVLRIQPSPLPASTCKIYCQSYDGIRIAVMVEKNHPVRKDIKRSLRRAIRRSKKDPQGSKKEPQVSAVPADV